jgi:hypothetical protein
VPFLPISLEAQHFSKFSLPLPSASQSITLPRPTISPLPLLLSGFSTRSPE